MTLLPTTSGVRSLFGVAVPLRTFVNRERYLFDQVAEKHGLEKAQRAYTASLGKEGLEGVSQKVMNQAERLEKLEARRTRLNDQMAEDFENYDDSDEKLKKLEALIEREAAKLLELRKQQADEQLKGISRQEDAINTFLEVAEAVQSEFVYRLVTELRGGAFRDGDTELGTLEAFRGALTREHIGVCAEVVDAGKPARQDAVRLILAALTSEQKLSQVLQLLSLPDAELSRLVMTYAAIKQRELSKAQTPTGARSLS